MATVLRAAAVAVVLLFAAGCGTTTPSSASPDPAPAEGPVPALSLVPGAVHLHRMAVRGTVDPGPESAMGPMVMELTADVTWRVVSAEADGSAILDCTIHRIHGAFSVASVGMRMAFDTDDPAFRKAMAGDNPMRRAFGPLLAAVGTRREWTLRKGKLPTFKGKRRSDKGIESLLQYSWLDILPPVPLQAGARGDGLPVEFEGGGEEGIESASWEIAFWDPGTGVADIVLKVRKKNVAKAGVGDPKPGDLAIDAGDAVFRDRFHSGLGAYISRRIHMKADGRGSFFPMEGATPANVTMEMDVSIDRVESFGSAPSPPK